MLALYFAMLNPTQIESKQGSATATHSRLLKMPLHPLLVHLPIGMWVASVLFDIFYMANHNPQLAAASFYCMVAGLIGAAFAIPAGLVDYFEISPHSETKRLARSHMLLNFTVTGLFLLNAVARYKTAQNIPYTVMGSQLILSLLSIILLGVAGYIGGLLVFDFGLGQNSKLGHPQNLSSGTSTSTFDSHPSDDKKKVA